MVESLETAPTTTVNTASAAVPRERSGVVGFLRRGALFVLIGLVLYLGLYVAAERLVYGYALRNRFFLVHTAPLPRYDQVILGASHAAVFDFEDMNARLEALTGSRIINLSVVGSGVVVNRLLLDYFLAKRETTSVVYFLDSFAFYSRQWNEERLNDTRLFVRAPLDPTLGWLLLRNPASRLSAVDYLSGFSKINNPDRFSVDIGEDEALRFNSTYRPIRQIDAQRIRFLYPDRVEADVFHHYLGELEDLLRDVSSRGIRLVVIKPPIPERVYTMLPEEAAFDAAVRPMLQRYGVEFHDLSLVANEDRFYYNTDHLNRTGVLYVYENYLGRILARRT